VSRYRSSDAQDVREVESCDTSNRRNLLRNFDPTRGEVSMDSPTDLYSLRMATVEQTAVE
jgi:hypothetical protein